MKTVLVASVLMMLSNIAPAGPLDPQMKQLAEELMELSNVEQSMAQVREHFVQMTTVQLKALDVPEEMRDKLATEQKKVMDLVFDSLSWEKMKDAYVAIYADVYTRDELAGLVDFYKSPVGQSFINKTPLLMTRVMETVQGKMQELAPAIKKLIDDLDPDDVDTVGDGDKQD